MKIKTGDYIFSNENNTSYAIVYVSSKYIVLCQQTASKNKLLLFQQPTELICKYIDDGLFILHPCKDEVVDENNMSEASLISYKRNIEIVSAIEKEYGPDYLRYAHKGKKPILHNLMEKYNLSRPALLKIINKYLQSGCQLSSLTEKRGAPKDQRQRGGRMRGRKPMSGPQEAKLLTDIDYLNMEESVDFLKNHKSHVMTRKDAYVKMLEMHYTTTTVSEDGTVSRKLLPIGNYPSISQYYSFLRKNITPEEDMVIKTSYREYRNNHRALTANERVNLTYPGELCDIDATPVDIYLVSKSDPTKLVNRGHMYFIIDVLTGMIISGSVSFEDNSNAAVSNVLANLKKEGRDRLLEEAGIILKDESYWPSDIRPGTLRCDRGSEFVSQEFRRKCGELGITIQLVPAATGSMKGTVEKEFHQFNLANSDYFEHKGLILKRYDSDHKETACLNISDLRKIMVSYILYHNSRAVESRQRSPEMIDSNVSTSPVELWKFHSRMNAPHKFTMNINQFIWALMKPAKASMTREGIRFKGLYYICRQDMVLCHFMMCDDAAEKMEIRYDEASMRHIYYIRDNFIYEAELNIARTDQAGYANMSYSMFNEYRKKENAQKKQDRQRNIQRRIEHNERLSTILSQKENSPKPESTDKIRENSKIEKETDNLEHQLSFLVEKKPDNTSKAQVQDNTEEKPQQDSEPEVDERDKPIVAETEEEWREIFLKRYGYKK